MKPTLPGRRGACAALLTIALAAATSAAAPPHFELARSEPAAGDTVSAVSSVSLWFSEPPQEGSVSIHLLDAASELVPAGDPVADDEDPSLYRIKSSDPLPTGDYVVTWRGMGDDGHVVRDDFDFTVAR